MKLNLLKRNETYQMKTKSKRKKIKRKEFQNETFRNETKSLKNRNVLECDYFLSICIWTFRLFHMKLSSSACKNYVETPVKMLFSLLIIYLHICNSVLLHAIVNTAASLKCGQSYYISKYAQYFKFLFLYFWFQIN